MYSFFAIAIFASLVSLVTSRATPHQPQDIVSRQFSPPITCGTCNVTWGSTSGTQLPPVPLLAFQDFHCGSDLAPASFLTNCLITDSDCGVCVYYSNNNCQGDILAQGGPNTNVYTHNARSYDCLAGPIPGLN